MREIASQRFTFHAIGIGYVLIPIAFSSFLSDPYSPTKWLVTYFLAFSILLSFTYVSKFEVRLPKLGLFGWLLAAVTGSYVISFLMNLPGAYENHFLDAVVFIKLAIISFNFFTRKEGSILKLISPYNAIATTLVLIYGGFQYFGAEPFPSLIHNEFPSSTFGFQNMAAEFIGISILIQVSSLKQWFDIRRTRWTGFALLVLLITSLAYQYVLICRSANYALVASLLPFFFLVPRKVLPKILPLALLGGAIVLWLSLGRGYKTQDIQAIKEGNTQIRIIRWRNTLALIQAHPFGIGPGHYEFGYLPFRSSWQEDPEARENLVVRSPHNGYLEAMAESGIVFGSLLILALVLLMAKLFRLCSTQHKLEDILASSILIFIAVDALFAFPMENAYPFYVAAIFMGYILTRIHRESYHPRKIWTGIGIGSATAIVGFLGLAFGFSKIIEVNWAENYSMTALACDHFPSNWRPCIHKARFELKEGKPGKAVVTLQNVLGFQEHNFLGLRLLSYAYFELGRPIDGCQALKKYDALFGEASSLHSGYLKLCKDY